MQSTKNTGKYRTQKQNTGKYRTATTIQEFTGFTEPLGSLLHTFHKALHLLLLNQ